MEARIPISPDQEDVLFEHALTDGPLAVQPDERAWIRAQIAKKHPGMKIVGADLDILKGEWVVTLQ